ncbi:hypothetical protein DV736_g4308, partial [Chaetothyriales sp. CBS 134916]
MDLPPVPPKFTTLQAAHQTDSTVPMNLIGVCTDYKDVIQSRGSHLTMTIDLHDPFLVEGYGLEVRFFQNDGRQFPKITNTGDIVILYNVKKITSRRGEVMISNSCTTWVVLEYESVRDTILRLEHPENRRAPLITRHPTEDVSNGQRFQATKDRRQKFTLISDAIVPNGAKGIFGDMLCEIRRIWNPNASDRCELYVTDYTENSELFDYGNSDVQEGIGHDYGDRFGYVDKSNSTWPGPWGKMTMTISCWSPHCHFVTKNVEPGDYVYLWNVHITYDRNGTRLEGHCRTEKYKPDKINVQIFKRTEAETDEKFKALLRRKREYEEHCKTEGIAFIRDARTIRTSNKDESENNENTTPNPKSKKNRNKKDQKKAQRAKTAAAAINTSKDATPLITAIKQPPSRALITNAAVRCNNIAIPVTPITTILSFNTLQRKTPSGNIYQLPFQNSCYKSRIRVVDFFPDNLEDFCAPIRDSDYSCLSDCESVSDADVTSVGDDGVKWEWRFILLVEDAKPTSAADGGAKQMELLVSGTDGDFLLREDPCNLREDKKALAKLKEILFHLWGDLQEQKEEMKSRGKEGVELVPKGRPFECFIKEYGVPAKDEMGKEDKDVKSNDERRHVSPEQSYVESQSIDERGSGGAFMTDQGMAKSYYLKVSIIEFQVVNPQNLQR